jgi:hypothetical protein
MSVCVYSVFVLFGVQVAALRWAGIRPRSPTYCVKIKKQKTRPRSTRAVDRYIDREMLATTTVQTIEHRLVRSLINRKNYGKRRS